MKKHIFIVFLLISFCATAQTKSYAGTYNFQKGSEKFKQNLTLNQDGTFVFYSYEFHESGIPQEKHFYAKGSWKQEKKIIYFSTKPSDFNNKYTVDFNKAKARYDSKSSRDKSNRDIKTSIRFYDCDVFWVQGKTFFKDE